MKPLLIPLALGLCSASAIEITQAVWPSPTPGSLFDDAVYIVQFADAHSPGSDYKATYDEPDYDIPFAIGIQTTEEGICHAGYGGIWEWGNLSFDVQTGEVIEEWVRYFGNVNPDQEFEDVPHEISFIYNPQTGAGSITWSPPASQVPDNSFPIALLALGIIAVATKTRT